MDIPTIEIIIILFFYFFFQWGFRFVILVVLGKIATSLKENLKETVKKKGEKENG